MTTGWSESPIGRHHDRQSFDCSSHPLNEYLARYARQNHENGGAKTFVATPSPDSPRIIGYYSLSPTSVEYTRVPETVRRGLGRYEVPLFRLGRLAVDLTAQGRGLGGALLIRAARRSMDVAEQVGGVGLLIDAKDEAAARWYESYDALPLLDTPLTLLLPFAVAAGAISRSRA